ncbi:FAD-dependent oxidoreductase [Roseomonas sp. GCM10028921]
MGRDRHADILVVGGGLGGIAATLSALALGARRVVLTEEFPWLGGQLTSQGVPLDEGPWVESGIGSRSYAALREGIRNQYRRRYPLAEFQRRSVPFNPGMGNIGTLCAEPAVAVRVIEEMLGPWQGTGRLTILRRHKPVAAHAGGDHVRAIMLRDLLTGQDVMVEADLIVDATETGELLPLAGVEHVLGAESRDDTGELHAIEGPADPLDQQALTWCMALSHHPGEDHTIARPDGYEGFRDFRPPFWPGPLFDWTVSNHVTHEPLERPLFAGDSDAPTLFDLWHARRVAWRHGFEPGFYESDITIANWPQMDYWWRPAVGVPAEDAALALDECRRCTLSFLHWMQTEAPRHDGGAGYPGLKPRGDVLGTSDGLAQNVYWREGYRIVPEQKLLEQHIGVAARPGATAAEFFRDSIAIGAYRIDLHPSTVGTRDTVDIDCFPFQIPLGALLPVRVENLLPACKNLGTTRITNGAARVHQNEWSIGEASGALAAFALARGVPPRVVRARPDLLAEFQTVLAGLGAPTAWPTYGALTPRTRTGYRPPM